VAVCAVKELPTEPIGVDIRDTGHRAGGRCSFRIQKDPSLPRRKTLADLHHGSRSARSDCVWRSATGRRAGDRGL
jgi:hypothetical protein